MSTSQYGISNTQYKEGVSECQMPCAASLLNIIDDALVRIALLLDKVFSLYVNKPTYRYQDTFLSAPATFHFFEISSCSHVSLLLVTSREHRIRAHGTDIFELAT